MKLCNVCHKVFADEDTLCPEHGKELKPDALVGLSLGGFKVTGWLGEGGMGVLYRAEHEVIGRKAAVKVIRGEYITDERMAGRFEQEARTVAKIGHPHLIDIFDIGTTPDGRLYYVMELLEGRALSDKVKQDRPDFQTLGHIMVDAMQALEAAHAVNIVHRDLKPDNIFLVERPGEPPFTKVLDFGIAKVLGMDEDVQKKLTKTGSIIGTPQYMAPEQIKGGAIDARADVYALGVILYELCVGRPPFVADTMGALLVAHMLEAAPRFNELTDAKIAGGLPPSMEAVCFRALAKEAGDRYQTVRELREDVERVLAGQAPQASAWWDSERSKREALKTMPGHAISLPGSNVATMPGTATAEQTLVSQKAPKKTGLVAALAIGGVLAAGGVAAVVMLTQKPVVTVTPASQVDAGLAAPAPVKKKKRGPDVPALRSKAIGVVSNGLKDGDPVVRKQAAETLSEGRDARHHSMLAPLLGDVDLQVRAAAAETLGRLGARAAAQPLRDALGKEVSLDPFVGQALAKIGDDKDKKRVTEQLKKLLKSGPEGDKFQAALVLSDLGSKDAQKLLSKVADKASDNVALTLSVLSNLARNGDDKARAQLTAMTQSEDGSLALQAARELARLGDERAKEKLIALAGQEGFPGRLLAYRALASLDDFSGYDLFSQTFTNSDKPTPERVISAQGLGASGDRSALEVVTPALDEGDPMLRLAAAGAVLSIAALDPKLLAATSFDWASSALADSRWSVRAQAASILADADAGEAVPLLKQLLADKDVEVRRAAVAALGKTKSQAAAEALGTALSDEKSDVRLLAVKSLSDIGGEAAGPILEKHVETAKGEEKAVAAGALVKLGKRGFLDQLKEALKSKDENVRRAAVEQAASDPEMGPMVLAEALKDKSQKVQLQAAVLLADKGSQDGVEVLQKAVKKGGADSIKAFAALTHVGVEPVAPVDPLKLLDSKDAKVRLMAVNEASRLPADKASSFWKRALKDRDPIVRMAAVGKVGELAATPAGASVIPLLKKALQDDDPGVRAKAEVLVARYAPPPPPPKDEEEEEAPPKPTPTSPSGAAPTPVTAPPDMATLILPDLARPPDLAQPIVLDLAVALVVASPPLPDLVMSQAPPPRRREKPDMTVPPEVALIPGGPSVSQSDRNEASVALIAGEVAMRKGKYVDAVREFKRVQSLDPRQNVWFQLGDAYREISLREDDPARRKEAIERAINAYRKSNKPRADAYAQELEQQLRSQ